MGKLDKKFLLALAAVFLCCFVYWGYLVKTSSMIIRHDALDYESLGRTIKDKGWVEFFRTGPHREPLYPASIAVSMTISDLTGFSYQKIQVLFQLVFLFAGQILLLCLLRMLNIHALVQLLMVLYMGISPALVNSALSLFSEIMAYPLVLGAVLLLVHSWADLVAGKPLGKMVLKGGLAGAAFFFLALNKGVFEHVFYACLLLLFFFGVLQIFKKGGKFLLRLSILLLAMLIVFEGGILSYKFLSKIHNGNFTLTNRFARMLYGSAYKRAEPMSSRVLQAHLASIPGGGFCRKFFSEGECSYAEFYSTDEIAFGQKAREVTQGLPVAMHDPALIHAAFEKILSRPGQFALYAMIENCKMFFWESTQIGFVEYPAVLDRIFLWKPFKDGLRLALSLWGLGSFVMLLFWVVWNFAEVAELGQFDTNGKKYFIGAITIWLIVVFNFLYALFSVLTRYALPIVPLYFVCIAICLDRLLTRRKFLNAKAE